MSLRHLAGLILLAGAVLFFGSAVTFALVTSDAAWHVLKERCGR